MDDEWVNRDDIPGFNDRQPNSSETDILDYAMMTSSNGNIFRVTGPLCGEFTGPGEFPTQRPVTRSFDVFFDLRLNKRLSKQSWGWWFETPSWSLWRQCNAYYRKAGFPNLRKRLIGATTCSQQAVYMAIWSRHREFCPTYLTVASVLFRTSKLRVCGK